MGEAIITRGCYGGGDNGSDSILNMPPTEGLYNISGYYTCTRSGNYHIQCVGGGGGASGTYLATDDRYWTTGNGGYGGKLNNTNVYMNIGDVVQMTIGTPGTGGINSAKGNTGGTTSFGSIISAAGGAGGTWIYGGSSSKDSVVNKSYPVNNIYQDTSNKLYSTSGDGRSVSIHGRGGTGSVIYTNYDNGYYYKQGGNGYWGAIVISYLDYNSL